ncbi:MAG TPA: DinB family protein [Terriglobales bacterium]|nr:DinB family protein [Terriglobales bacterium]
MTIQEARQSIDKIERGPETIAAAVKGLSPATLRYKPSPAKWCILEIVGHLADVEVVYGHRLRQALAEAKPTFAPMDQEAWAANLGYTDVPVEDSLEAFRAARKANVRLLRRVSEADLSKGGFHPELKSVHTVADLIQRMVNHDPNHLGQIERLKQQAAK